MNRFTVQILLDKWIDQDYSDNLEDALILASIQAELIGEKNVRILDHEGIEI
jgi:hypothetical protein